MNACEAKCAVQLRLCVASRYVKLSHAFCDVVERCDLPQTDANLFFVMELVTGGDLMFHVDDRAPAAFKYAFYHFTT